MRIWFLSNGHGEDRASAAIAAAVRARRSSADIVAAPLVTGGTEYTSRGVTIATSGAPPPSGGFSTAAFRTFVRDLPFARRCWQYVRVLRHLAARDDQFVSAGDVFLTGLARVAFRKPGVHVALAKSVYGQPHTRLEARLLRGWTRLVFARDQATADHLGARGVRAVFEGNPLVDGLAAPFDSPGAASAPGLKPGQTVLLLPGSRREAPANLLKLLDVAECMPDPTVAFGCAWSPAIPLHEGLNAAVNAGWTADGGRLTKGGREVAVAAGQFEALVARADVVVGLAGTANEQAAAAGKPVVTLVGCGPQTTTARMAEQERLLGGAAQFVAGSAAEVAGVVAGLLARPEERRRRGDLGVARLGPPGAAERIARGIIEELGL